jgi:hypothetical protein
MLISESASIFRFQRDLKATAPYVRIVKPNNEYDGNKSVLGSLPLHSPFRPTTLPNPGRGSVPDLLGDF